MKTGASVLRVPMFSQFCSLCTLQQQQQQRKKRISSINYGALIYCLQLEGHSGVHKQISLVATSLRAIR